MGPSNVSELVLIIIAGLGGGSVIALGLLHWFGNFLSKRILKNMEQVTSARLEQRVHVSKAQFDVEFEIYKEIWRKITALRFKSTSLWTSLFEELRNGTLSKRKLEEFDAESEEFDKMYSNFIEFILSSTPFIPTSITEAAPDIAGLLRYPVKHALKAAHDTDSMSAEDRKAELVGIQQGCNGKVSQLATLIRERLADVSIVL